MVTPAGIVWSPEVNPTALEMEPGQHKQLILDLRSADMRSLYILDIHQNPVLRFKNNKITGKLTTDEKRREGSLVANWEIEKHDNGLMFSGEIREHARGLVS